MGASRTKKDNISKCRYEISPPIWWTCPTHHQTSMFFCSVNKLCAADSQSIITYSFFFCIYHQKTSLFIARVKNSLLLVEGFLVLCMWASPTMLCNPTFIILVQHANRYDILDSITIKYH